VKIGLPREKAGEWETSRLVARAKTLYARSNLKSKENGSPTDRFIARYSLRLVFVKTRSREANVSFTDKKTNIEIVLVSSKR